MGWILSGTSQQHEDTVMRRYAPDMMKDPIHLWLNRLYFVPLIILGLALFAVSGWQGLFWGVFFRVTFGLHATWLVNSATHMWGSRRFETTDDSTNSWWVALLTFGEGWHNNHHAFPRAARHGLKWYEIDVNWYGITVLRWLGLAKSINLISKAQIEASDEYGLRKAA
jgi:stearoyl-CoA desaturase (delta-9 desaturase)